MVFNTYFSLVMIWFIIQLKHPGIKVDGLGVPGGNLPGHSAWSFLNHPRKIFCMILILAILPSFVTFLGMVSSRDPFQWVVGDLPNVWE